MALPGRWRSASRGRGEALPVGRKVEGMSKDETWAGGIRQTSMVRHSENCNTGSGHRSHQFAMYSITRTLAPPAKHRSKHDRTRS